MRFKHAIITIALILCLNVYVNATPLTLNEVLEGSCRISVPGALGSGVCIDKEGDYYIFLTNGHVVEQNKTAYIELFRNGYKSYKIPAIVLQTFWQKNTDRDFALLAVHDKYVNKCPPRVIPLVPLGYEAVLGYTYSAGCPEGRWLSGWEGRIEEKKPTRIIFTPPPVGGQSGSGLLVNITDKNGELQTRVGGIITFRIGENGIFSDRQDVNGFALAKGVAIPISTLYKILGYDQKTYTPIQFPSHYIPTTNKLCPNCHRLHIDHALGSDNKYYCVRLEDGNLTCGAGLGVQIIRWPDSRRIVPIPKPSKPSKPNDGNPFGDNLPNILPDAPSEDEPTITEITQLKEQIQQLQQQINNLTENLTNATTDYDTLFEEKQKLESVLQIAQGALSAKEKALQIASENLHTTTVELTHTNTLIDNQNVELHKTKGKLGTLTEDLTTVEQNNNILEKQVVNIEAITNKTKKQRNWLGGIGGLLGAGLLFRLIWLYWNNRGRAKANKIVDNVQDKIGDQLDDYVGDDIVDRLNEFVDDLQDTMNDMVDDAITSRLPPIAKRRAEKKTLDIPKKNPKNTLKYWAGLEDVYENELEDLEGPEDLEDDEIDDNADTLLANDLERNQLPHIPLNIPPLPTEKYPNNDQNLDKDVVKPATDTYNKEGRGKVKRQGRLRGRRHKKAKISRMPQTPVSKPVSLNITNNNTTNIETSSFKDSPYIRELFQHKAKDGEKTEDWALLGTLYKEAIKALEGGKLYYKGKTKLLGQAKTAQQINDWVGQEFFNRMTQRDVFSQDELYKEAMLGFLYKDAVDKLAAGNFNVLGYRETAKTIRNWVHREFLKRLNINI